MIDNRKREWNTEGRYTAGEATDCQLPVCGKEESLEVIDAVPQAWSAVCGKEENMDQSENREVLQERYGLVLERIREMETEGLGHPALDAYFKQMAAFSLKLSDYYIFVEQGHMRDAQLSELQTWNRELYEDILPEHYDQSWGNPAYSVSRMDGQWGQLLSFVYGELRDGIVPAAQGDLEDIVVRMELLVEIYSACVGAWQEQRQLPPYETIRQIAYWHNSDYSDIRAEKVIRRMACPEGNPAVEIIMGADLEDVRYLYRYGLYVTENELETARFLCSLPQETIDTMADTYTEGYRMGFEVMGKDLSKKSTVDLYYNIGFERMLRRAVENFAVLGLKPVARELNVKGAIPNRQYTYDHKDDHGLFWDKALMQRKLEVLKTAYEQYKQELKGYAGPAAVEIFGEEPFAPESRPQAVKLTPEQQKLWVEYSARNMELYTQYITMSERSFTIIAFPVPEIGENFRAIFEENIKVNTLDYMKYRQIQQCVIDALDQADHVEIKGMNGNTTDLTVNLWKLQNPEKETIFENCVADVNIPVGEVFTSPVLKGTNGVLHVSKVFLNGLEYKDLSVTFRDGMIADYGCGNFPDAEEGRRYIKENVLFHRDTLPLGEFAIGTNTTAYVMARRWNIENKLPILIAEKTGPHFAVGDTCYSQEEDVAVYNPDGKEVVARENEKSRLRNTDPMEAYFNCHTDITLPFDELGELTAVKTDGTRICIIADGRFVLPGSEALNEPLEQVK